MLFVFSIGCDMKEKRKCDENVEIMYICIYIIYKILRKIYIKYNFFFYLEERYAYKFTFRKRKNL